MIVDELGILKPLQALWGILKPPQAGLDRTGQDWTRSAAALDKLTKLIFKAGSGRYSEASAGCLGSRLVTLNQ